MSTRTHGPLHGRGGFSMVEILVVMVLMAITSAMILPKIAGMIGENALQGALNRVATDLTLARIRAIRGGSRAVLAVSADGGSYYVIVDPTGRPDTVKRVKLSSDYKGLTLSPVGGSITFDSRGMLLSDSTKLKATRQSRSDSLWVSGVGRIYRAY